MCILTLWRVVIMILELLAKKYNIEPPTDPLMSDMCLHIDDVDLMTLYFTGIISETVYAAKDVLLHLVTDEKYVYVLDVFLERYKDDILDYNTALNNAIVLENVAIINSMMNKLEYSDLDLSRNSYSVVYKALKCQYRVYDPVLNKLKEYYDYSKVVYKGTKIKVEIICKEHGSFFQRPQNHMRGEGCPKCSVVKANKTKLEMGYGNNFSRSSYGKFKGDSNVYVFKLYNKNELFYKIGITKNIGSRIKLLNKDGYNVDCLYNYKLLVQYKNHTRNNSRCRKKRSDVLNNACTNPERSKSSQTQPMHLEV